MLKNLDDMKISVIIPTLNAEKYIGNLLMALMKQSVVPDEVIVIDSSSEDNTEDICVTFDKVKFISIDRKDFDHGGTRAMAAELAVGDYILFMTQDALPADNYYIENIVKPLSKEKIPMVSGRQCPREDARYTEKLTRYFNYPQKDFIRTQRDIPVCGIKTFFVSDVCSAYRRKEYEEVGGFPHPLPVGEDMIMAAKFIYAGYSIAYAANAKVIHSHNFSLKQQFRRNFDIGVYLSLYSEYFDGVTLNKEGAKMVKFVFGNLLKNNNLVESIYYICECIVKLMGNKFGKRYKILPDFIIERCSMNKNYWEK